MRARVVLFLCGALLSLSIVPLFNIVSATNPGTIKWQEKSFLYNVDFISKWIARILYPLGISIVPQKVIIGADGWLFLGDGFGETLTVDRRPPSKASVALGQQLSDHARAWEAYLAPMGVKLFSVMIAPNKGTIYSEKLPAWARPATQNATDAFFARSRSPHYIDLRTALLAAKANQAEALYYKTDTHWNKLGANAAFQAFAQQVGEAVPEIKWPLRGSHTPERFDAKIGGDLANFLRLSAELSDLEPVFRAAKPPQPLNDKRVLWVRDSFGEAMAPLMIETFSEIFQVYSGNALKSVDAFVNFVNESKPDYVFVTLVERDKGDLGLFARSPPSR